MKITYRQAAMDDLEALTKLHTILHNANDGEFYESDKEDMQNNNMAHFIALDGEKVVAFAHVAIRHEYINGTNSSPVGMLEGIYVLPEYRKHGIAQQLVLLCENWVKDRGCIELASDCYLENTDSLAFHLKIGFIETERIIMFSKKLSTE